MTKTVFIISGPAGVGKSTTSKKLVKELKRSAYISGDDISHIPVNGSEKPWLCRDTLDLIWKNILSLTKNLLDYDYYVVIDYVAFPVEVIWLSQQLNDYQIKIVYVVLLVNKETITFRDQLRPEEAQMGERSLILLEEFENQKDLKDENKFYTDEFNEMQLTDIIEDILNNKKFILS